MHYITLDYSDDLLSKTLELVQDKSILIFPTRAAAEIARLTYQKAWTLQDVMWISMEDFKQLLLLSDKPVLDEDKRLICLYQVMSESQREHFHINSFSDLKTWGTQYFQFLSELYEAGIPILSLEERIQNLNLNLRLWQEANLQLIQEITLQYKKYIEQKGFADKIFHAGANQALMPFSGYRIISVNQYYFSVLEKDLLRRCEDAGNAIVLLHHGVEMDPESMRVKDLQPAAAWERLSRKPNLELYICENEQQCALAFLSMERGEAPCAIVDSSFYQKEYSALFPAAKLSMPASFLLRETRWYRILAILNEIHQSLWENPGFIPLRLVLKYFSASRLLSCLLPAWQDADIQAFDRELNALHKEEILYLDLQPEQQFEDSSSAICQFSKALSGLLAQISGISSVGDLAELMNSSLDLYRFATRQELENTDLLPQVWSAMANLAAIEQLELITSWSDIFEDPASGIYEMCLNHLQNIRLKRIMQEERPAAWEVSNLLDSRNRVFRRMAVFNMVEGMLPQAPSPIWLLNEHQRKLLGLKTYDDIRDWERYYFMRLVFCAQEVKLFAFTDPDKAVDISSFIGELQQFTGLPESFVHVDETQILKIWQEQMRENSPLDLSLPDYHSAIDADFFTLPYDRRVFSHTGELRLSSYELQLFTYNPFAWYLSALRKIKPRNIPDRELMSPTLFGTLLHAYFARVLGSQAVEHRDLRILDALFNDGTALRKALEDLIHSPAFRYKMPQNYNADYLNSIIRDCLALSLREFYRRFMRKKFAHGPFVLIPENEEHGYRDNKRSELLQYQYKDELFKIIISGRADLRIEDKKSKCIVDFKTGGANKEQLIFYEWLYYLLDYPDEQEVVQSYFWLILDMKIDQKAKSTDRSRERYLQNIQSALALCLGHGFCLAQSSTERHKMKELSRSDLYLPGVHDATL